MITNINKKYKDRDPQETIDTVFNFFESRGFRINIYSNFQSEAGTWSCHLQLFFNDKIIVEVNGKGTTEKYSLASGCGEMYERFCNKICYMVNIFINYKLKDLASIKGYMLDPNEKILETNDELLNIKPLKDHYNTIFNNNQTIIKDFLNTITYGCGIGVPYTSVCDNNDIKYFDPRILQHVNGSMGMVAGNSIPEALNQGMSELYEEYVRESFFLQPKETYYAINLNKIENPILKNIITNIENLKYKIFIYDLSRNFNMPVLMSVLVDSKTKTIAVNFGAFPVFEIAFERILTELYQGIKHFREEFANQIQVPFRMVEPARLLQMHNNSITLARSYPEDMFERTIIVDNYNENVFLPTKEYSNEEINNYYFDLNKKLGNNFYYRNTSLCDNMVAIHIVAESLDVAKSKYISYKHSSPLLHVRWLEFIQNENLIPFMILNNYPNEKIIEQINKVWGLTFAPNFINDWQAIYSLMWDDHLSLLMPTIERDLYSFLTNIENAASYTTNEMQGMYLEPIHDEMKKYVTLAKYLNSKKYSREEIKRFFNLFDCTITDEDIDNGLNRSYLIKKVFIEPMQKYYNSEEYLTIITNMFP